LTLALLTPAPGQAESGPGYLTAKIEREVAGHPVLFPLNAAGFVLAAAAGVIELVPSMALGTGLHPIRRAILKAGEVMSPTTDYRPNGSRSAPSGPMTKCGPPPPM